MLVFFYFPRNYKHGNPTRYSDQNFYKTFICISPEDLHPSIFSNESLKELFNKTELAKRMRTLAFYPRFCEWIFYDEHPHAVASVTTNNDTLVRSDLGRRCTETLVLAPGANEVHTPSLLSRQECPTLDAIIQRDENTSCLKEVADYKAYKVFSFAAYPTIKIFCGSFFLEYFSLPTYRSLRLDFSLKYGDNFHIKDFPILRKEGTVLDAQHIASGDSKIEGEYIISL